MTHARIFTAVAALAFAFVGACAPFQQSQDFARREVKSPYLRIIHATDAYTVFYDSAIKRCVIYAYVREMAGNGLGVGVGVDSFECDPTQIHGQTQPPPP